MYVAGIEKELILFIRFNGWMGGLRSELDMQEKLRHANIYINRGTYIKPNVHPCLPISCRCRPQISLMNQHSTTDWFSSFPCINSLKSFQNDRQTDPSKPWKRWWGGIYRNQNFGPIIITIRAKGTWLISLLPCNTTPLSGDSGKRKEDGSHCSCKTVDFGFLCGRKEIQSEQSSNG